MELGQSNGESVAGIDGAKNECKLLPITVVMVPFGATWQNANPGQPSEFKYNAKLELPRTAGAFRAVVIDGGGKEVSDVISGNLKDRTHDVLVTWWKR